MFKQVLTYATTAILLGSLAGCSSNDGGTNPPPVTKPARVVVTNAATAPSYAVNDAVWAGVTPTALKITQSIFAAPRQSGISSVADSVKVQAVRWNDSLWVRLQWKDNSHNVWPNAYSVADTAHAIGGDTILWFNSLTGIESEDQVLLLFTGLGTNLRDVWDWRALTTDAGFAAEGMNLKKIGSGADSLLLQSDSISHGDLSTGLTIAQSNMAGTNLPQNVSVDTSEYTDYRLYADPAALQQNYVHTHGWSIGQRVPGYLIDTTIYTRDAGTRGSRWDIRATSDYTGQQYTVVMVSPMGTSGARAVDDIDFTTKDSVETQIGVYDNDVLLAAGHFTKKFWLIF